MRRDGPDIVFFPPLLFAAAIIASLLLEWIAPLGILPAPRMGLLAGLGAVICVGAVSLAIWGLRTFKAAGTNTDPRDPALKLVETGPYRFTRNPMYLGMVVFQIGLALAASLDWSLPVAPVLWLALHRGAVLREEAYLQDRFGQPYADFMGRTRRWL